ncbi:DUF6099 family protein [Streptomyces sp. TRM 70351]|uniref:DUF6099 family protein n=1 Tax=Streptomyces sp. TRM 70351 TaxID=3116552 RepID=UPI002E7BDAEB|nr:DUF6099 family protein [Streptomyces sp. TRM 70351]MEE1926743.1 DUF6099 family protein [Streptomyces sp. TRM 70351]
MDAVRLISVGRSALARCGDGAQIVAEAWQAHALAQAVGGLLARTGPEGARAEAGALCEAGAWPRALPGGGAGVRAARLTEVREPGRAVRELGLLLGAVGAVLAEVAAGTEEEALYWQCLEAIDATGECADRAAGLLHRLTAAPADGPPG